VKEEEIVVCLGDLGMF